MSIDVTQSLDARGLNCPLPILRTKKTISGLTEGDILEVTSTDPGSLKDIQSFCTQTGHELMSSEQSNGDYVFLIRKN
ncbi:MAG: sulfurtransferase TusA family protein [Gammaproteobacteria bacterium]|nr:sulfurtransferase TusA family protein [Gammaproteobacteria bacterium]